MGNGYYRTFSGMVGNLPAKGVFRAIELERRMLEDDMARKRDWPTGEEYSILDFCYFLEGIRLGTDTIPCAVPPEHLTFYRKTVERLIKAGELPSFAQKLFDTAFSPGFLKPMAT